jgi:hypothetical protein
MVFEVTQQIIRTGSFTADSPSDALTLARQKFEKPYGYAEHVSFRVQPIIETLGKAAEALDAAREVVGAREL